MAEDWEYQHKMRVWEAEVARQNHLFSVHLTAVCDFASLAIKSIILANSASAGAVLALLGTMWGDPGAELVARPAIQSVAVFAAGVLSAMICAALSYCAQYSYAAADWYASESAWRPWLNGLGIALHAMALIAAIVGIASFGVGAVEGLNALDAAQGGLAAPQS
jgi:hypothetical protein